MILRKFQLLSRRRINNLDSQQVPGTGNTGGLAAGISPPLRGAIFIRPGVGGEKLSQLQLGAKVTF